MFDSDNLLRCDFCENGTVTKHIEQIKFRQLTDRGYVFCRAEVSIGICNRCSSKHWNKDAEAIVDDIVRQEYEKLRASKLIVSATAERWPVCRNIQQEPT